MLTSSKPRRGFSLVELLIVIVLLGLVVGSLLNVVMRQQRFYRGASELIETRSQVRQAIDLLPSDMRSISTAGTTSDLISMGEDYIRYRSSFGVSAVCMLDVGRSVVTVPPPDRLAAGNTLTSWLRLPEAGDSIMIFDEGVVMGGPGTWELREITSIVPLVGGCAAATGYTSVADADRLSYVITLSQPLSATVQPGDPIRIFEHVNYELYQASDAKSYLGVYTCRANRSPACEAIQPVSGPYLPYSQIPEESGLTFQYFDAAGNATTSPGDVARIRIAVRGATESALNIPGLRRREDGTYRDSLDLTVTLRNR